MATRTIRFGARFIDSNGGQAGGAIDAGSALNAITSRWIVPSAGQQVEQFLALVDMDGNAATSAHNARNQAARIRGQPWSAPGVHPLSEAGNG